MNTECVSRNAESTRIRSNAITVAGVRCPLANVAADKRNLPTSIEPVGVLRQSCPRSSSRAQAAESAPISVAVSETLVTVYSRECATQVLCAIATHRMIEKASKEYDVCRCVSPQSS